MDQHGLNCNDKEMKNRLRKKLHKAEFQELGFSFEIRFKEKGEDAKTFLKEFIELLRSHHLEMGGGWNAEVCGGFVTREKGSVTLEEYHAVKSWLEAKSSDVYGFTIGELRDAWYGWA